MSAKPQKPDPDCDLCKGDGWVCEEHDAFPAHDCPLCNGAGIPCRCNPMAYPLTPLLVASPYRDHKGKGGREG